MSVPENQTNNRINTVVDHFFRHESGRMVATLAKRYGASQLEQIEDAVQEALLKATQTWPFKGVPDSPSAWIFSVAQNKLLDTFKKEKIRTGHEIRIIWDHERAQQQSGEPVLDETLNDDLLKMMFACCHPKLSKENQIILTLKILCGFSKHEIARGLMKSEAAVSKSYTRAKKRFRTEVGELEVPIGKELNKRLESVITVIYMIFNEGYHSIDPENLIKRDVCGEAMRLCWLLLQHKLLVNPKINALMALMLFHASRFEARVDEKGNLITLEKQDRNKWDKEMIREGEYYLNRSSFGAMSEYHIQAAIAAVHCLAPSYKATDWRQILTLYDRLIELKPGSSAMLHRIVAYSKVHGARKGLQELDQLATIPQFTSKHIFFAIKASLEEELKQPDDARKSFEEAIRLTENKTEKKFLRTRIQLLNN